jgi:hypothetical protein
MDLSVFRLKITIAFAYGLLGFLLPAGAQNPTPAMPTAEFPAWLAAFPGAHEESRNGTTEIDSSYRVPQPPAAVTAHYREQLQRAKIHFDVSFDGIGTVIRCAEGKSYCVVQIREIDDGSSIKVSYSAIAGSSVGVVGASDSVKETPAPVSPAPGSPKAAEQPSNHQIEYVIEGTAGAAGLTYRNAGGGTEQNDVSIPTALHFTTVTGAFVYISAQKKGREGIVRVAIRVDGILMRQSTSSSPFGIATASGRVVDRKIIY